MLQACYPTKKALKASIGKRLRFNETSFFGQEYKSDGKLVVADYSPKRSWFAEVWIENDLIVKVK